MRVTWLLVALYFAGVAAEQPAEISGTVRDSSQAPIVGARITVTNQLTRSETIYYTDKDGFYRTANLAPQSYTVEAFRTGYAPITRRDLIVTSNSRLPLDFELPPASGKWVPASGTLPYLFLTSVISALVLLLFTEPGRKLLQKLWSLFEWMGNKTYELLAPRFPDRIGLPGYRKRVQRDRFLGRIEHPIGPPESEEFKVTIDRAFTPLALVSGEADERIDLFSFAAKHEKFLVLGGPGSGKTTLMKNLVISILAGRCNDELNGLVPVFVTLREMAAASHGVEEAVVAALAAFRFKKAAHFVDAALEAGRMLIILDGLDEVGASREAISSRIKQFCQADEQRPRTNHLIVTCRENSYRTRDLADVIGTITRVEPFAPQHMRTFLQGWPPYKGKVALGLLTQIQADPQILDICRNPLLLTILTGLYLDKEKFDLPTSRNAFYYTAIDELLVQRPGRKHQRQDYTDLPKKQVLQRIALDRLETVRIDDDPEVLSRERLFDFAKEVLGSDLKEPAFQLFLNDLENVNSIIKPVGEGTYVLSHRTFQEYLAAREADRTREPQQVIFRFSGRPELSEVLCFFCGMLKNIPQISSVLDRLLSIDPLLAGRCLLNVTEPPARETVAAIVESLFQAIRGKRTFAMELDILSSAAQRAGQAFDSARNCFSEAIELIIGSPTAGPAGFISALATRPELAMKLVPGLLTHQSPVWRSQAVYLLESIGSDDAVIQLIQLIDVGGHPEREIAATLVANLIPYRSSDLKEWSSILKERQPDKPKWPFEEHFPGRMVLAILEAWESAKLSSKNPSENPCLNAAYARRMDPTPSKWDRIRWEHVTLCAKLNSYRRSSITALAKLVAAVSVFAALSVLIMSSISITQKKVIVIQIIPPKVMTAPNRPLANMKAAAASLYGEIEHVYPPTAKGWAKILPWNWDAEPNVPSRIQSTVRLLHAFSINTQMLSYGTFQSFDGLANTPVSPAVSMAFRDACREARAKLPPMQAKFSLSTTGVWLAKSYWTYIIIPTLLLFPLLAFLVIYRLRSLRNLRLTSSKARASLMTNMPSYLTAISFMPLVLLASPTGDFLSTGLYQLAYPAIVSIVLLSSLLLGVDFPPNPYMKLVEHLGPLSTSPEVPARRVPSGRLVTR